jgi:RimJ/RimL family protein N-acetyltransferase
VNSEGRGRGFKCNRILVGVRMSDVYTRVLLPADTQQLREIRLEALQKEGHLFASSYEVESNFPFENWKKKCTEDGKHCTIGLFYGTRLIGISLILPYDNDASGRTGLLGQSYIKREYRGKGLGNLLYSARMKWILDKSSFESAVVYVRDGNSASIALNRKSGAQYLESREMMCGDGKLALWHWYKFSLDSTSRAVSKASASSPVSRAPVQDQVFG